jgi:cytoskeletal protein CcmA (bactofilin family)
VGIVSAEGPVEFNGVIEGDLHCTSLHVSKEGRVNGKIVADDVVVNGTVEGPVNGAHVHLQSSARVTGDIQYETLIIDKGGYFAGRSIQKEKPENRKATKQSSLKEPTIKPPKESNTKTSTKSKVARGGTGKMA